jgi:hypothetical protein
MRGGSPLKPPPIIPPSPSIAVHRRPSSSIVVGALPKAAELWYLSCNLGMVGAEDEPRRPHLLASTADL